MQPETYTARTTAQQDPTPRELIGELALSIAGFLGAVLLAGIGILISVAIAAAIQ